MLAKKAATLDEISGGRLILGLGAGWNETEYRAFGFPFDHRVSRFEEAFTIIRTLLREGRCDFEGTYYQLRDCELLPRGPRPGRAAADGRLGGGAHAGASRCRTCRPGTPGSRGSAIDVERLPRAARAGSTPPAGRLAASPAERRAHRGPVRRLSQMPSARSMGDRSAPDDVAAAQSSRRRWPRAAQLRGRGRWPRAAGARPDHAPTAIGRLAPVLDLLDA